MLCTGKHLSQQVALDGKTLWTPWCLSQVMSCLSTSEMLTSIMLLKVLWQAVMSEPLRASGGVRAVTGWLDFTPYSHTSPPSLPFFFWRRLLDFSWERVLMFKIKWDEFDLCFGSSYLFSTSCSFWTIKMRLFMLMSAQPPLTSQETHTFLCFRTTWGGGDCKKGRK